MGKTNPTSSMLAKDSTARPRDGSHVVAALEALDSLPADSVSIERNVASMRTRQSITANEQQLLCVVLTISTAPVTMNDGASTASNVTMTPEALADAKAQFSFPSVIRDRQSSPGGGTLDDLKGVAAAYGGRVEWLVDGSLMAVFQVRRPRWILQLERLGRRFLSASFCRRQHSRLPRGEVWRRSSSRWAKLLSRRRELFPRPVARRRISRRKFFLTK